MKKFRLKAIVYPMLLAGSLQVGLTSPLLAAGIGNLPVASPYHHPANYQPTSNHPIGLRQMALPMDVSRYRFRPLSERQVKRTVIKIDDVAYRPARWQYRKPASQRPVPMPFAMPALSAFHMPPPVMPGLIPTSQARQIAHRMPPFMRQYAWSSAQPRGFRRGGEENHYANQAHNEAMTVAAPEFRTAPVSTQGYRFRNPSRNARFVSFSERVKAAMPAGGQQVTQTISSLQPMPSPSMALPTQLPIKTPINTPVNALANAPINSAINSAVGGSMVSAVSQFALQANNPAVRSITYQPERYQPGRALAESGNFRFRPVNDTTESAPMATASLAPRHVDSRLPVQIPVSVKATASAPAADGVIPVAYQAKPAPVASALPANPAFGERAYALTDAQVIKSGENPWSNWSFRPVDSTF